VAAPAATITDGPDSTTASNGLTLTGKDARLGGPLTGATVVSTTGTNTLAISGLLSGAAGDSIVVANASTGVLARRSASALLSGATTNTLTNSTNTITTTVNGIAATAPAVNTVSNTFTPATRALVTTVNGVAAPAATITDGPDSTTASNGLTLTGKDARLGGPLTAATTITTSVTNTLALAGIQSGKTTDSILVVNPTTNVVRRISAGRFKNGNLIVTTALSLILADTVDVVIFRGALAATITLPSAASNVGKVIRILNYAVSNTNVDITLSPAPVIQGGITDITNPTVSNRITTYGSDAASAIGNSIEVVSDGTNWYKLGN
jgi:hypothetical protein